ncbi:MAG: phosphatase PAP2 family protein [Myxococcota bacterium]
MIELLAAIASDVGLGLALTAPLLVIKRRGLAEGRRLAIVLAITAVVVLILQMMLMRPRPNGAPLFVVGLPFYGFPSGHAAIAVAAATYLFARRPSIGWGCAWLAAAGVALLRVSAGVHFYTDIVAGAALGTGIAVAGCGIAHGNRQRKAWSWLLFPWLGMMVVMSAWASAGIGSVDALFFTNADKVIHVLVFGLCGFLTVAWLSPEWPLSIILCGLVGIVLIEESLQGLWPGRSVDPVDAFASVTGTVLFGLLAKMFTTRALLRDRDAPNA